jgi:hypothetical protein
MRLAVLVAPVILLFSASLPAQNLAFDLAGPPVDVRVERGGKTLPISQVPNLAAGDRLWIHPDLPESQSVHYLLIVAFLRGSTNPPPDEWFTKAETWDQTVREEGISVIVPPEAQQAVIFLAPQTTGDFSTLRAAVRGRPGSFVRAAQDLQEAGHDRVRLERYLTEIKSTSDSDPTELQRRSTLLARSLKMKLDQKCFDKPAEQQAACLTQNSDQLVLDDTHSQSMLATLANGATADLMNQISYSRIGGAGAYSAYVGAIVDFARIMGSMHSAQYQYIPALAVPKGDSLSLKLNNPPSFRKPKSVLVVALPSVQRATPPPLRALGPDEQHCLQTPTLVLPADGAPLVFATPLAHDLYLQLADTNGDAADVPITADPAQGGFVLNSHSLDFSKFSPDVTATVRGSWGFSTFDGPSYKLRNAHPETWSVAAADRSALIIGREDDLHLSAQNNACVSGVRLRTGGVEPKKLDWKAGKVNTLDITLPLQSAKAGEVTIEVSQYGRSQADQVSLQAYAEAARFDDFSLHAGDREGVLKGKRLDQVSYLQVGGVRFLPGHVDRRNDHDEQTLTAQQSTDSLPPAQNSAEVTLQDGRMFSVPTSVLAARPRVVLISKGIQTGDDTPLPIHLTSDEDLPTSGRLVFFIKSLAPVKFSPDEKIEVATADNSFRATLAMSNGTLVLQDAQTALGILDPEKAFGASAFGPVQFRAVGGDGTTGDWQPLGTLVRLPAFKEIRCAQADAKVCMLTGASLFLLSAVSTDPDFQAATAVPDGFTGQALPIAKPTTNQTGSTIYLKLRDDPSTVQSAMVPLLRGAGASAANTHARTEPNNR